MESATTNKTTKLFVPHTCEENIKIAGVLEQLEPDKDTNGRNIALVLHGWCGHKDYLFQKHLALQLPMDSFRFDFRGNFETPGVLNSGNLAQDLEDLQVVVAYLTSHFGYKIDLIVGHSRGSVIALRWMCIAEEAKTVSGFVNVSGRYRMKRIFFDISPADQASINEQGYYNWDLTIARQRVKGRTTRQDMEVFANWDSSLVCTEFPQDTHVLTIHGIKDERVPVYDAVIYARALGSRSPGTHNLCLVEEANHNFIGEHDFVIETVLDWLGKLQQQKLHTGIWNTGVYGRL